ALAGWPKWPSGQRKLLLPKHLTRRPTSATRRGERGRNGGDDHRLAERPPCAAAWHDWKPRRHLPTDRESPCSTGREPPANTLGAGGTPGQEARGARAPRPVGAVAPPRRVHRGLNPPPPPREGNAVCAPGRVPASPPIAFARRAASTNPS